jgi:hypothetical protein
MRHRRPIPLLAAQVPHRQLPRCGLLASGPPSHNPCHCIPPAIIRPYSACRQVSASSVSVPSFCLIADISAPPTVCCLMLLGIQPFVDQSKREGGRVESERKIQWGAGEVVEIKNDQVTMTIRSFSFKSGGRIMGGWLFNEKHKKGHRKSRGGPGGCTDRQISIFLASSRPRFRVEIHHQTPSSSKGNNFNIRYLNKDIYLQTLLCTADRSIRPQLDGFNHLLMDVFDL